MARRPPIAAIRKLLLVALLLAVVGVVGLFLFGRTGQRPPRLPADADEGVQAAEEGSLLIGEDFDYTFTEGKKPSFRIRGESIRADRQGTIFLEDVALTLYDEQGRQYHVESKRASFNRESNEGRLQGDVILRGPDGLELRTPQLQMRQKGRMLVAPALAELRYGPLYKARSQKIWVHLPEEVFVLAGKVVVESIPAAPAAPTAQTVAAAGLAAGPPAPPAGPPAVLTAERLIYERKRRQVRLEGSPHLQRGREFVKARKLAANLSQDERTMVFLRALWDVTGQIAAAADSPASGGATTVRFKGRDLAVFMQPESNEARKVALDGGEQQRAQMEAVGGGVTRLLTARRIEGILAQGVLASAEAFGGVEIDETAPGQPGGGRAVRHAEGQRAQARFSAGGQLAGVDLVNNVVYRDPQVRATGDRANVDFDAGNGEFLGDPVDVVSERGKLKAPRVLYETKSQLVHAVGGVRGVMEQVEDTSLAGSPLGEGEGPVWVESQEAFWRQSPSSFLFRGDVRAWRGKSLLLASELRGDKAEDQLTGKGGVKTVWIPPDEKPAEGGRPRQPAGSTAPASGGPREPIEVTAKEMAYRQGAGILTYTGDVRVLQTGKTLTCNQLEVEMGEDKKAETMTCTGEAKLNDPKAGRNVAGDRAVYHLDSKLVEMFGETGLVTMRDRDGNQVQGKRLVYHIDDGKVEVLGGKERVAPAAKSGGAE